MRKPPAFQPGNAAECIAFWDASAAQSYASALLKSGSATVDVTLSGAQTVFMPMDLRVECVLLGVLGVAKIRVSDDGGTTWLAQFGGSGGSFTAAATLITAGLAAGYTLNVAAGTMAITNVWQVVVTAANSLKNAGDALGATTTAMPRIKTGANGILGRACWGGNGTTTSFLNSTITIPATTSKFLIWGVCRVNSSTNFGRVCGPSSGNIPNAGNTSTTVMTANNGAGVTAACVMGTPKRFVMYCEGTTSDYFQWGSSKTIAGLGANLSPVTGFGLFSLHGGASTFLNCDISSIWVGLKSPTIVANLEAWMLLNYSGGSALQ